MIAPEIETPAGGSNHAAGVNTHNTGAIVDDAPAPVNTSASEYVHDLAERNRAQLLAKAAIFASANAPHTLWKRRMKAGNTCVDVRLEWPGVLVVYDPATGEKRAISLPGQPTVLQKA